MFSPLMASVARAQFNLESFGASPGVGNTPAVSGQTPTSLDLVNPGDDLAGGAVDLPGDAASQSVNDTTQSQTLDLARAARAQYILAVNAALIGNIPGAATAAGTAETSAAAARAASLAADQAANAAMCTFGAPIANKLAYEIARLAAMATSYAQSARAVAAGALAVEADRVEALAKSLALITHVPASALILQFSLATAPAATAMHTADTAAEAAAAKIGIKKDNDYSLKEWACKFLFEILKKRMMDMLVDSVVQWIQNGGDPYFVTNWEQFLLGVVDEATGAFIDELNLGFLCQPFQAILPQFYTPRFGQGGSGYSCTLSRVVDNVESFYQDFENGGWVALQEATFNPANSFYGAFLLTWADRDRKVNRAQFNAWSEVMANAGFKSQKECETDPVTGREISSTCRTITPGYIIGNVTTKYLGSDIDYIVNSQDLQAYIAAITDAAINRLLREGLTAISSIGDESGEDFGTFEGGPEAVAQHIGQQPQYAPQTRCSGLTGAALQTCNGFGGTKTTGGTSGGESTSPSTPTPATRPAITSLSPSSGEVGTVVTITGTGFTPTGNSVRFGSDYIRNLPSLNGTTLTFTVPGAMQGCGTTPTSPCSNFTQEVVPNIYSVIAYNQNGQSGSATFRVTATLDQTPAPIITLITPSSGTIGTPVTISGRHFEGVENAVRFGNGYIHNVQSFGETAVVLTIPSVLQTCPPPSIDATCVPSTPISVTSGTYSASVVNANGRSNSLLFIVQ